MRPAPMMMVEFERASGLARMLRQLRAEGYSRIAVYSPYSDEEIDALLPGRRSPVGWIMLAAGAIGGTGAYFLQWFATHDYPLNVGGRPLHSWPAFVPVTFELTILSAAIAGVIALLWLARLPRLDGAVFADSRFWRASQDRFFLCVQMDDPRFTAAEFDRIMRDSDALSVGEVEG